MGWGFEVPSIKRQTDKGFPSYTDDDVFVFGGEELVPLSNPESDWRCENEAGFQRFRRIDFDGDHFPDAWEITEKSGLRHYFGQFRGQNGRWSVVNHPTPPAGALTSFDRTYSWSLNTTVDLHGNRIDYEYLPPNGDLDSSGILYPSRITYSHLDGNYHEVRFRYEERPDRFEDYRPTFSVTIGKRLVGIAVHSFNGGADHLVRDYALEYTHREEDAMPSVPGALDLGVSTLKRIVQHDRTGQPKNYLPPLLFGYSAMRLDGARIQNIVPPELDLADPTGNVQIADVDGDSLPDIIKTAESITGEQVVCFNRGEFLRAPGFASELRFSSATIVVPFSSNFRLGDVNSTLMDIDGNGLTDFVRIDDGNITGKQLHIFSNRSRLDGRGVSGFVDVPQVQPGAPRDISFSDPSVRQMDVNFDKQSDFIRFEAGLIGSFRYYYRNLEGSRWTELGPVDVNPDMSGYDFSFFINGVSNPHVHLADMNGDRLQDLVYIESTSGGVGASLHVRYWPYCALGRWGTMREMTLSAADLFQVDALDLRDLLVQDLTGDGLADIAAIRSDGGSSSWLELRVNIAGRRWSTPFTKFGLPRHLPRDPFNPTTFRQADLNANGSTDLIWRNSGFVENSLAWLELLPTGKPNLLTQIDNSLGKSTEITYGNAVDDMIRAREAGYPWQTWCPFPMQVVRRIRTTCGLDLDGLVDSLGATTDQYVSEFRYRDAFYDGFEREFRGFAFAQRIDFGDDFLIDTNLTSMGRASGWNPVKSPTGQVSAPSLVTRFRYLTGASDNSDNDEYPAGWTGAMHVDEVTPNGGREEEILKGRQIWEEKIDPWILHDAKGEGDFDRGAWLVFHSTNAVERTRLTPDDYVYSRIRQEWTVRRLYRPQDPALAPPGRFGAGLPAINVLGGHGGSGRSVSFAFVSAMTNEILEANGILRTALSYPIRNPIVTAKANDYDDYGNQTAQRDFGVVLGGTFDDERFTSTEYALGREALPRWILDRPSRVRTTDENGVFVAETRSFYDGAPLEGLALGLMGSRGLLHRSEQVVTDAANLPELSAQSDRPGDPRLPAGSIVQRTRSEFDTYGNSVATLDPLGNPQNLAAGHARRVEYDAAFRTYPVTETIVVGGTNADLVITAGYDLGFGVITRSTDFNGNITSYQYDSFARLVAIVKPYDSENFPSATFEYAPGDPTRSRVYRYDRAGNLTLNSSDIFQASSRVISRLREVSGQPGTHVTVSYSDGCGRKLAEAKEAEIAGRWVVSGARSFNRRMGPQSEWLPYEIASGADDSSPPHFGQLWPAGRPPATSQNGDPVVISDKRSDPTGREIININPPEKLAWLTNDAARTRSFTQFLPLEKRLFDENDSNPTSPYADTPMVHFTDGLGRLLRVHEIVHLTDDGNPLPSDGRGAGGEGAAPVEWPTHYRYDLNDQLVHIRDSQDNEKWFRYDGLGRKLFMNDPDRGVMSYTYDDASNLCETLDAKSQRITYTFDGVNRIMTEDYKDAGSPAFSYHHSPDVLYHYDLPAGPVNNGDGTTSTARNTRGFLSFVEDTTGEEHTGYDARGRVEYVIKRIADPRFQTASRSNTAALVNFRTAFQYDSLDRLVRLTYPDLDEVAYNYNPRNLLKSIHGLQVIPALGTSNIVAGIVYRPSVQLARIDYGNGVRTIYDYDPRQRLTELTTLSPRRGEGQGEGSLIHFQYDFDGVSNIRQITDARPAASAPSGDKRRNTQVFGYDDLYRLTRAQYSFNLPGEPVRNDGEIHYRYDRIGNMLAQTSTIVHSEKGLPVANLGDMESGGASGRSGRIGRGAAAAPGPHALTRIVPQVSTNILQPPVFAYDANGNMTVLDGLTNTWDFKDRLVRVENAEMVADYRYDYTDRRITKRVAWKLPPVATNSPHLFDWRGAGAEGVTTVTYIDKYSEVRNHSVFTKYVWNGDTRVARLTASLSPGPKLQRLPLAKGWNLVSPAVGGSPLPVGEGPGIRVALRWNDPTLDYTPLAATDPVSAHSVLWLFADADSTLALRGLLEPVTARTLTRGGYVAGRGTESMPIASAFPADLGVWYFDAATQSWCARLTAGIAAISNLPSAIGAGEALYGLPNAKADLAAPRLTLAITFYHEDHLRSSSIITDGVGQLLEENSFYAFGPVRSRFHPESSSDAYRFAQKEQDRETGNFYFEARYLNTFARFNRTDPLVEVPPKKLLLEPQKLHPYSYAANNPVALIDPDGRFVMAIPIVIEVAPVVIAATKAAVLITTAALTAKAIDNVIQNRSYEDNKIQEEAKNLTAQSQPQDENTIEEKKVESGKEYSKEKEALVDMAKGDKRKGITKEDMESYKELNRQLKDAFPLDKVRGPEQHPNAANPISREPHGHVGPVGHIPIKP